MTSYPTLRLAYAAGVRNCTLCACGAFAILRGQDGAYIKCEFLGEIGLVLATSPRYTLVAIYTYTPPRPYARAGWRRMDRVRRSRK